MMMDDVVKEVRGRKCDPNSNWQKKTEVLLDTMYNAAHYINLMFGDFEKKIPLHQETMASAKKHHNPHLLKNKSYYLTAQIY